MVADDGQEVSPESLTADELRRWRRQQWLSRTAVEGRTSKAGRGAQAANHGLPSAPGTSKCNKIEHRLFSFITVNWRGKPLRSYRTIVQLIAATNDRYRSQGAG
jgi:hypothetical protein